MKGLNLDKELIKFTEGKEENWRPDGRILAKGTGFPPLFRRPVQIGVRRDTLVVRPTVEPVV